MSRQKLTEIPMDQWIGDRAQWERLAACLLEQSGLPGPRANLELSGQFAQQYARAELDEPAWELLLAWAALPAAEAGVNERREFLPFCAVQAAGVYYSYAAAERRGVLEALLQSALNDSRWRLREAGAIGLQSLGEADFGLLRKLLEVWAPEATLLEQRGVMAALAHPPLLKRQENAMYALRLAEGIMDGILSGSTAQANPEDYRVLSKGLEYSLSVFTASAPEPGFALLRRFAATGDPRLLRIVKSNLGKTRLSKRYAAEVAELLAGLTTL
ncbi:hypothetical protein [Paenibacillus donghaensis]|uniref:HEAT repeat domain-containing protein n=1 Tax=Paenibacillus donghaensis TaxID=414771 RepID=A0A2Z2K7A8_9BACL|nr:hypothetical protein [Paenibacillus donghaensis]ASA20864.1 hypothetical protein B9T62_08765 [Paenibacillus donghaensis]